MNHQEQQQQHVPPPSLDALERRARCTLPLSLLQLKYLLMTLCCGGHEVLEARLVAQHNADTMALEAAAAGASGGEEGKDDGDEAGSRSGGVATGGDAGNESGDDERGHNFAQEQQRQQQQNEEGSHSSSRSLTAVVDRVMKNPIPWIAGGMRSTLMDFASAAAAIQFATSDDEESEAEEKEESMPFGLQSNRVLLKDSEKKSSRKGISSSASSASNNTLKSADSYGCSCCCCCSSEADSSATATSSSSSAIPLFLNTAAHHHQGCGYLYYRTELRPLKPLPRLLQLGLLDLFLKSDLLVCASADALASLHAGESQSLEVFHSIDAPGEFVGIDACGQHLGVCRALGFTEFGFCPIEPRRGYDGVHANSVTCIAVAPDGTVATGGCDAAIALWGGTRTDDPTFMLLTGHADWVRFLHFFVDGLGHLLLLSGGDDGQVLLWGVATGALLSKGCSRGVSAVRALTCTWDGSRVALAFDEPQIEFFSAGTRSLCPISLPSSPSNNSGSSSGSNCYRYRTRNTLVTALHLFKAGTYLAFASEDENVTVVKLRSLKRREGRNETDDRDEKEVESAEDDEDVVIAVCTAHAVRRMCASFMTTVSAVRILTAPPDTSYFTVLSVSSEGEIVTWTIPARLALALQRNKKKNKNANTKGCCEDDEARQLESNEPNGSRMANVLNFAPAAANMLHFYNTLMGQQQQQQHAVSDRLTQRQEQEEAHEARARSERSVSLTTPPSPSSPSYRQHSTGNRGSDGDLRFAGAGGGFMNAFNLASAYRRGNNNNSDSRTNNEVLHYSMSGSNGDSGFYTAAANRFAGNHTQANNNNNNNNAQANGVISPPSRNLYSSEQVSLSESAGYVHKRQIGIGPLTGIAVLQL